MSLTKDQLLHSPVFQEAVIERLATITVVAIDPPVSPCSPELLSIYHLGGSWQTYGRE